MTHETWQETTLGEQLTFQRGFDITKKQQTDGPYFVITSSGPTSTHSEFKVRGPGVVIGRKGTLGTVFYTVDDYWPHDTTLRVNDFHGNEPRFAYYFLKTLKLEQYDCGASNPTLNRNHIHGLRVRYPDLVIQRKVAALLSAYDDLIENNTRRIAVLEEMSQSLYREWFAHFRFPSHEQTQFIETERGRVPEGWIIGKLEDAVLLQRGFDITKAEQTDGPYPVVTSSGPTSTHTTFKVKGPGVVIGRKGTLGTVFLIEGDYWPHDTTLWVKEFRQSTPLFAYYLLDSLKLGQYDSGASNPTLNRNHVHLLPVVLPPRELLDEFENVCQPLLRQGNVLGKKNHVLRQTRDMLLPKVISGELNVEHLDIDTGDPEAETAAMSLTESS